MRPATLVLASLVTALVLPGPLGAQGSAPRIGQLDFPASASGEAHRDFVTGVLWMHSFEYPRAAAAFQRARHLDPGFAMAYWGEAMTHTHPVWNEQDLDAARAVLAALGPTAEVRRSRAPTERERMYLDAVEVLYGEGGKPRRDTLYAEAMERLVRAYPDDLEAKAFYALALIGLSQGVRDTATYNRAAAWADTVFRANPRHPGAAHYLIHAWDDPQHAHLGLAAARAYAGIAPDAAHAQHMTTHIFLALGMWDEVISQNTLAMDLTARLPGHYTSWLHYALLQQGRFREATAFLAEMRQNMVSRRQPREASLAWMRAAHVAATDAWEADAALWAVDVPPAAHGPHAAELHFQGEVAFRLGLADSVAALERRLRALAERVPAESPLGREDPVIGAMEVMALQLAARRQQLAGDEAAAIRTLRRAADREDALPMEFGPPLIAQPSHELLGMALAGTGDAAGAVRAFQRSLARAPGRGSALLGLAGAAVAAEAWETARQALARLTPGLHRADPEWRTMVELIRGRLP